MLDGILSAWHYCSHLHWGLCFLEPPIVHGSRLQLAFYCWKGMCIRSERRKWNWSHYSQKTVAVWHSDTLTTVLGDLLTFNLSALLPTNNSSMATTKCWTAVTTVNCVRLIALMSPICHTSLFQPPWHITHYPWAWPRDLFWSMAW